ncbi:MAG: hypothetical protein ACLUD2_15470 [Clostridium sp.]
MQSSIILWKRMRKEDRKIETADRPAQAGKGKSGKTDPEISQEVEEKSTQKKAEALKKIQEEREMRNAAKRELEEGLAKSDSGAS